MSQTGNTDTQRYKTKSYCFPTTCKSRLTPTFVSLLFFIPWVYKALTFLSLGLILAAKFYSETCLKYTSVTNFQYKILSFNEHKLMINFLESNIKLLPNSFKKLFCSYHSSN